MASPYRGLRLNLIGLVTSHLRPATTTLTLLYTDKDIPSIVPSYRDDLPSALLSPCIGMYAQPNPLVYG